ncbi:hypothetical protein [Vibrio agarivorans]|uniref:hypothetical protein n=1 Tax=Vibrio agarivorans TaxID=153622 RepID=UPI0025B300C4|nr:hypothetical protein [Vibrio agarivorans]MDN3661182.1 hypothetical protein [Vibrio agarivorans]
MFQKKEDSQVVLPYADALAAHIEENYNSTIKHAVVNLGSLLIDYRIIELRQVSKGTSRHKVNPSLIDVLNGNASIESLHQALLDNRLVGRVYTALYGKHYEEKLTEFVDIESLQQAVEFYKKVPLELYTVEQLTALKISIELDVMLIHDGKPFMPPRVPTYDLFLAIMVVASFTYVLTQVDFG